MFIPENLLERVQKQTVLCDAYTSKLKDVVGRIEAAVHIPGTKALSQVSAEKIKDIDSSLRTEIEEHFQQTIKVLSEAESFYRDQAGKPEVTNLLQKIEELKKKKEELTVLLEKHDVVLMNKASFAENAKKLIQRSEKTNQLLLTKEANAEEIVERTLSLEKDLDQIVGSPYFLAEENSETRKNIERFNKQLKLIKALKNKGEVFADNTQLCRFLAFGIQTESIQPNNYEEIVTHAETIKEIFSHICRSKWITEEQTCFKIFRYVVCGGDTSFLIKNESILGLPRKFFSSKGVAFLKEYMGDIASFPFQSLLALENKYPEKSLLTFFIVEPQMFKTFCSLATKLKKRIYETMQQSSSYEKEFLLEEDLLGVAMCLNDLCLTKNIQEGERSFFYSLSPEIRVELFKDIPHQFWPTQIWYDIEGLCSGAPWEKMVPFLSACALSFVPPEILARFLAEKPEDSAIAWLQETIFYKGQQVSRVSTLSELQRDILATRFRDFDQKCTSAKWLDVLGLDKAEAEKLCQERFDIRKSGSEDQFDEIFKGTHGNDLLSFFQRLIAVMKDTPGKINLETLLLLLFNGSKKEEICGGRTFLTLRGTSAVSSLCCAQDGYPLRVRDSEGILHTYFPRGMFNGPTLSIPAYTLCSLFREEDSDNKRVLFGALDENNPNLLESKEDVYLFYEIQRIAAYLRATYPFLEEAISSKSNVCSWYGLLKEKCREFIPTIDGFSGENGSHGHALFLLSIVNILKDAWVAVSPDNTTVIKFTQNLAYCLSTVPASHWRTPRVEDQPELTEAQLREQAADYFPHTLTAITPQRISPQIVAEAINAIQALSPEQYETLCAACMRIIQDEQDVSLIPDEYLQEWEKYLPKELENKEAFLTFITEMRNMYYGVTSEEMPVRLRPDTQYRFDPTNVEQFATPSPVPDFLVGEGNFANALCVHFTPVEPERHDGNCGVNSFLLGLYSENVYMDEESLEADIRQFRNDAVRFASEHRDTLAEKFSSEEVDRFIASFAKEPFTLWSSEITWECAAGMTGRPVKVYTMQGSDGTFTTDENSVVKPNAVFMPSGEPVGPPIHLMYYGSVHYCLLQ